MKSEESSHADCNLVVAMRAFICSQYLVIEPYVYRLPKIYNNFLYKKYNFFSQLIISSILFIIK